MIQDVTPFVAGSYGAAVLVMGFLSVTTVLRYRKARARLAALGPGARRRRSSS